ncbi:hypothetical protein ACEPAG_9681 [Sanghuangporus baumii]
MSTSTSLLQDVLRPHAFGVDRINSKLAAASLNPNPNPNANADGDSPPGGQAALDDSDDELVGVMSIPGSPSRSAAPSRQPSRPSSPTRVGGASRRRKIPGPLLINVGAKSKERSSDPLRAFPTEVAQRIFALLSVRDLARCARVCRKWEKSQTLNYVWFQHVRRETFQDENLPPGKWTRRESKQSWRITYMQSSAQRHEEDAGRSYTPPRYSRPASPFNNTLSFANIMSATSTDGGPSYPSRVSNGTNSGYVTPKEAREEQWKMEAEDKEKVTKNEMREMYKELGGRKPRTKAKFGGAVRDKGGWDKSGDFDEY